MGGYGSMRSEGKKKDRSGVGKEKYAALCADVRVVLGMGRGL